MSKTSGKLTSVNAFKMSLAQFGEFLVHPVVPIEEIKDHKGEPINKIVRFWRLNRLVPFLPGYHHRVNISFADLIWLRILDLLREFSFPVQKQEKIADYFFKDAYDDNFPKQVLEYNRRYLQRQQQDGVLSSEEEAVLENIEAKLKDPAWLYALKFQINYLTNLITECIQTQEERAIMVFKDGRVAEVRENGPWTHNSYPIDPTEPHIYISISRFLREFIDDEQLSGLLIPQLLTSDEKQILQELKRKNLAELSITLHDGKIQKITSTQGGVITGQRAQEIKKLLALKKYESVTFKGMDDKSFSFKSSRMIKLE